MLDVIVRDLEDIPEEERELIKGYVLTALGKEEIADVLASPEELSLLLKPVTQIERVQYRRQVG